MKSSLEAAAAAAAKVNAMLVSKGKLRPPSNPVSIQDSDLCSEVEINDAPMAARNYLTKGTTQDEISRSTGAYIVTRGRYIPPSELGKTSDRPLYLQITAPLQHQKDEAVDRIHHLVLTKFGGHLPKRTVGGQPLAATAVAQGATPQVGSTAANPISGSFVQDKVFVGLDHVPATFDVRGKILGPGGSYLNHIHSETGCRVVLRGRGSGTLEQISGQESYEPLHISVHHQNAGGLEQGKNLARNLVQTVQQEFAQFQQAQAAVPPTVNAGTASILANIQQQLAPVPFSAPAQPLSHVPQASAAGYISVPAVPRPAVQLPGLVPQIPAQQLAGHVPNSHLTSVALAVPSSVAAPFQAPLTVPSSVAAPFQAPLTVPNSMAAPFQAPLTVQMSAPVSVQGVPGPVPSVPGPVPNVPGLVASIPGPVPNVPGLVPSMPVSVLNVPGSLPSVPGPVQSVPGPVQSVPGPVPSVPLPNAPGPVPSVPAAGAAGEAATGPPARQTLATSYSSYVRPTGEPETKRRFTEEKEETPSNLLGYQHGPPHLTNLVSSSPPPPDTNSSPKTDNKLMPPPPLPARAPRPDAPTGPSPSAPVDMPPPRFPAQRASMPPPPALPTGSKRPAKPSKPASPKRARGALGIVSAYGSDSDEEVETPNGSSQPSSQASYFPQQFGPQQPSTQPLGPQATQPLGPQAVQQVLTPQALNPAQLTAHSTIHQAVSAAQIASQPTYDPYSQSATYVHSQAPATYSAAPQASATYSAAPQVSAAYSAAPQGSTAYSVVPQASAAYSPAPQGSAAYTAAPAFTAYDSRTYTDYKPTYTNY